MMTAGFKQLEAELTAACERRAAMRWRPRAAGHPAARAIVPVLSLLVTVVIAGGALLLDHRGHNGLRGGAARHGQRPVGELPLSQVPAVERPLARVLSVLRRRRQATDALTPAMRRTLASVSIPTAPAILDPLSSGIRLAATTAQGTNVFLIPLSSSSEQMLLVAGGGLEPITLSDIVQGKAWVTFGPRPGQVVMVVPDGVSRVSVRAPGRRSDGTLDSAVHGNIASFVSTTPIERPTHIVWYGSAGHQIPIPGRSGHLTDACIAQAVTAPRGTYTSLQELNKACGLPHVPANRGGDPHAAGRH